MRTLERRVAGTAEELARQRHLDETTVESYGAKDGALEAFPAAGAPFDPTGAESRAAGDRLLDTCTAASTDFAETSAEGRGAGRGPSEAFDAASARGPSNPHASGVADERRSRTLPREHARLHTRWLDHDSLRVTFELSAETWALLERALEGARQKAATTLTDAEALAAVARDALASQNQGAAARPLAQRTTRTIQRPRQ